MSNLMMQVNVFSRESVHLLCVQMKCLARTDLKRQTQRTAA